LHSFDWRTPGCAKNDVAAAPTYDLRRSRLEPEVPHGAEGPQWIAAAAMLLADGHVIPRHEVSRMALVAHLDARQPLDVGDAIPARGDQADREPVLVGQRLTIHLVAQQVAGVERVVERHAAGELLVDRQAAALGRDGTRLTSADDPGVVPDRLQSAIDPIEHHFDGVLQETRFLQYRSERCAGP